MSKIKAVLFDMDGLVLDTEKLYSRFWREAAVSLGYPMTEAQALGMRSRNREAGEKQLKSYFGLEISYEAVRNRRIELMNAYIREHGVTMKPGVWELLQALKEMEIQTAITTSSPLDRTKRYLSMVGLEHVFDRLISGYMVERGKPEPDIYLYAAEELGVTPQECMVLEDSPAGILSAWRAGCIPVMVPDLDQPDEETSKMLYAKVDHLTQVIPLLCSRMHTDHHWNHSAEIPKPGVSRSESW